ncbi:TIGR04423 family type III CRISPR-associated protein [Campylobacter lari]|uniref:TIGR04423 family type III CRISPR-associated protein n=1 Tax=Campylobacter lari TaxID=201 RepID=A0A698FRI3_CAMLA|nr:TIGR04423 family type III CRISPR-associated protein [Campylobacter lari]EAJ6150270.1 TIGR04423 family type III CRISPR-associated protein [Campylobacter lari]EAL0271346.1 TIGR04423 family type III CRISPR-associated protein [Campylobacter lari]ECW8954153.1 TIGR04423 family type III CRISPR-associated protein [Campylobacter lari]MBT0793734.1 TIGR04423 family type III CRISPR-associated protein [Campylobacter lari]MBT0822067.1 TIGR04423 family type III CRISPR-associated protein [Campylobacter lar
MLKTIDQTREFYQSIPKNAQAYIQMSDSQEILFFQNDTLLPSWELLHNGKNFILEACFFDGEYSMAIRHYNQGFMIVKEKITSFEHINEQIFLGKNSKIKFYQVWQEFKEESCNKYTSLRPTMLLFAGFLEKGNK